MINNKIETPKGQKYQRAIKFPKGMTESLICFNGLPTGGDYVQEIVGIILWHSDYGYCKIQDVNTSAKVCEVKYCGTDRLAKYSLTAFGRDLKRKPLPLHCYATIEGRGTCQLIKTPTLGSGKGSFRYVVRFDETGDTAEFDEREIIPHESHPRETLWSRMSACDSHALYKVIARSKFLISLEDLHKETGGIESLIGSRVQLLPHQAFVAATVINDSVRRFVLADEVGLGKTIEAGLVINDILSAKPDARILILTPGALSRQWLCELHMSFGAQGFKLADLYSTLNLQEWKKVICSINGAVFQHKEDFGNINKWDLVVVDEAHHLLWNQEAYKFVERLSSASSGLLLLSAVPAREREDELLRLLRLLDPTRYKADQQVAQRFTELYRAQPRLGQGLRILDRDINDIEKGEASPKELELPLARIMRSPVVSEDEELKKACRDVLEMSTEEALKEAQRIRDLIVSRYRLSRRIIKNRRSQLVSQDMLNCVRRESELLPYEADGFELEAFLATEDLLEQLSNSDISIDIKHTFFRIAYLSLTDPVCASFLADELVSAAENPCDGISFDLLSTSYGASYDEYYDLLEELSIAVSPHLDVESVKRFAKSINAWIDAPNKKCRLQKLLDRLPGILDENSKLIVFAGAFNTAESLANELKVYLGNDAIEVFTFNLEDADKEKNVLRFRTQSVCRILVSDESGGEGRNFQFADAIIHYDLPWSVASIEQRVGRLDRIGRTNPVKSYLLYRSHSIEEGFVTCLVNGFKVFTESISGLEFMLRDTESSLIDKAITLEWEQVDSMAPLIASASDNERRSDDAEALTDAASFPGFGRLRFLNEISDGLEQRLENTFVEYFRCLARRGSAYQYPDNQEPNIQIWKLRPDEIRNDPLPGINKGEDGLFSERCGTFQRGVARERRDLDFFSVGNPLFDAVSNVAQDRLSGRVFAMGVRDSIVEVGNYLVAGIRCVANPNLITDEIPLQRRARRYFFGKRLWLVYRLGETELLKSTELEGLVGDAFNCKKSSTDLTKEGFHDIVEQEDPDWMEYLLKIQDATFDDARDEYQRKFGFNHVSMLNGLRRERLELELSPNGFGRDVEALMSLEYAIKEWQSVIDVIGVMQVSV